MKKTILAALIALASIGAHAEEPTVVSAITDSCSKLTDGDALDLIRKNVNVAFVGGAVQALTSVDIVTGVKLTHYPNNGEAYSGVLSYCYGHPTDIIGKGIVAFMKSIEVPTTATAPAPASEPWVNAPKWNPNCTDSCEGFSNSK